MRARVYRDAPATTTRDKRAHAGTEWGGGCGMMMMMELSDEIEVAERKVFSVSETYVFYLVNKEEEDGGSESRVLPPPPVSMFSASLTWPRHSFSISLYNIFDFFSFLNL